MWLYEQSNVAWATITLSNPQNFRTFKHKMNWKNTGLGVRLTCIQISIIVHT